MRTRSSNKTTIRSLARLWLAAILIITACGSDDGGNSGGEISSSSVETNNNLSSSSSDGTTQSSSSDEEISSSSDAGTNEDSSSSIVPSSSSDAPSSSSDASSSSSSIETEFEYEGYTYKVVPIGSQVWMAENLNYNVPGSKCGADRSAPLTDENTEYCTQYGRLYKWATAMALDASCNSATCAGLINTPHHQGICPTGWHIPTNADWDELYSFAKEGSCGDNGDSGYCPMAGKHLKAEEGWHACSASGSNNLCLDTYGFAALPGGFGNGITGLFYNAGECGTWWSSTELNADRAYRRVMCYDSEYADWGNDIKAGLQSVRCIKN